MNYLILGYAVYLVVAIGLIVWLGRTLSANGEVFLRDVFDDQPDLARAVNQLLTVGFYLLCLGYAFLTMQGETLYQTPIGTAELLAAKLGMLMLTLGGVHLFNVFVLSRWRQHIRMRTMAPPVVPQMWMEDGHEIQHRGHAEEPAHAT